MKRLIYLFSLVFAFNSGQAQISFGPTVAGTQSDINYLADGYLSPIGEAMAFGLTNGWYNTAKVKKTLRFELGFTPSVTLVPSEFQTFTIENSALQELELVSGSSASTPTVYGDDSPGPMVQYKDPVLQNLPNGNFRMPSGLGFHIAPLMQAHGAVGLPFDFELSARYLPTTSIPLLDGSEIGLWGVGLKHDLLRYIPGEKIIPFSLSAFVSYTELNLGQDIEPSQNNDKRIDIQASALVTRLLVSKSFLFITVYGGVGYNQLNANIDVSGTYDYINPLDLSNPQQSLKDPVAISSSEGSGFVGNVGVRMKFLLLAYVSADYTFGPFNAATLSLGISWDL